MNLFKELKPGKLPCIKVIVENCKGTSNKFEYDKEAGIFRLDRVLYSAVFWPFDYGFVPNTWHTDEDPVDVVLLTTYPTFPGCVVEARPLGVLLMEDEKGMDEKVVAVPCSDPRFAQVQSVEQLPEHTRKEIQNFFETYKSLEPGKFVKFMGWKGVKEVEELLRVAIKRFEEKFGCTK